MFFCIGSSDAHAVTLNGSNNASAASRFPSSFHVHLSALFIHHFGNAMISLKKRANTCTTRFESSYLPESAVGFVSETNARSIGSGCATRPG